MNGAGKVRFQFWERGLDSFTDFFLAVGYCRMILAFTIFLALHHHMDGLKFDVKKSTDSVDEFRKRINARAREENEEVERSASDSSD